MFDDESLDAAQSTLDALCSQHKALGDQVKALGVDVVSLRQEVEGLIQYLECKGLVVSGELDRRLGTEQRDLHGESLPRQQPEAVPSRLGAAARALSRSRRRSSSPKVGAELSTEERFVVLGGFVTRSDRNASKTVEVLKASHSDIWKPLPDIPWCRGHHTAAVLGGCLYVCGGHFNPVMRSLIRFDTRKWAWQTLKQMGTPRREPAAAAFAGHLYVCGGEHESSVWSSVERFRPDCDRREGGFWEEVPSMSYRRRGFAAVALHDSIMVCGGIAQSWRTQRQDQPALASAEVLRRGAKAWETAHQMTVPRFYHAMVALEGEAIAIGGLDSNHGAVVGYVESFDPLLGRWTQLAPLLRPRFLHVAGVLAGRVYICGGFHEESVDDPSLSSAECFDPEAGEWTAAAPMLAPRAAFCGAVLVDAPDAAAREGSPRRRSGGGG